MSDDFCRIKKLKSIFSGDTREELLKLCTLLIIFLSFTIQAREGIFELKLTW